MWAALKKPRKCRSCRGRTSGRNPWTQKTTPSSTTNVSRGSGVSLGPFESPYSRHEVTHEILYQQVMMARLDLRFKKETLGTDVFSTNIMNTYR